jgi:hypothetical protein
MTKKTAWLILIVLSIINSSANLYLDGCLSFSVFGISQLFGYCIPILIFPLVVWLVTIKKENLAFFYVGLGIYMLSFAYLIFGRILGYRHMIDIVR